MYFIYLENHSEEPHPYCDLRMIRDDAGINMFEEAVRYAKEEYSDYSFIRVMEVTQTESVHN